MNGTRLIGWTRESNDSHTCNDHAELRCAAILRCTDSCTSLHVALPMSGACCAPAISRPTQRDRRVRGRHARRSRPTTPRWCGSCCAARTPAASSAFRRPARLSSCDPEDPRQPRAHAPCSVRRGRHAPVARRDPELGGGRRGSRWRGERALRLDPQRARCPRRHALDPATVERRWALSERRL